MIKILILLSIILLFSGCVNKHGVSLKYYSDCEEYYDLQGYYHKDCGKDDLMTYKEMKVKKDELFGDKKQSLPKGNVW